MQGIDISYILGAVVTIISIITAITTWVRSKKTIDSDVEKSKNEAKKGKIENISSEKSLIDELHEGYIEEKQKNAELRCIVIELKSEVAELKRSYATATLTNVELAELTERHNELREEFDAQGILLEETRRDLAETKEELKVAQEHVFILTQQLKDNNIPPNIPNKRKSSKNGNPKETDI